MLPNSTPRAAADSVTVQRLLIAAQVLALIVLLFALQFLINTTGGTLFVFATIGPVILGAALLLLIGVGIYKLRRRHSLFISQIFEPGQSNFLQGDEGDCAYFIRSGEVEVLQGSTGAEKVVAKLAPGQYFGEMALLKNAPRNATVRAVSRTEVAVLGKSNFLTMLNLLPSTQEDIMKTVNDRAMMQVKR